MIEFAPSPTGPAHLGTLRSYCIAWNEATCQDVPLVLRYDMHSWDDEPLTKEKWIWDFNSLLSFLHILPTYQHIVQSCMGANQLPVWAIRKYQKDGKREFGFYPKSDTPFVFRKVDSLNWLFSPELTNLVTMILRGTQVIVRSYKDAYIRDEHEELARKHFGLILPEVLYTSIVSYDGKPLSKRHLTEDGLGTIEWAIAKWGRKGVLRRIQSSLQCNAIDVAYWE